MPNEDKVLGSEVNEESGLSIRELFYIVKKHLLAILIFVLAFTASGVIYSEVKAPVYQSTATMLVSVDQNEISANQAFQFSSYIRDTFVEFISQDVVLDEVEKQTEIEVVELKRNLTVNVNNDTLIISITYKDTDEMESQRIANTIATCAENEANKVNEDGSVKYKLLNKNMTIMTPAKVGKEISYTVKYVAIFFALGIVVAFLYVLIRELFNNKFKSNDEIERYLNIPVLAGIPEYDFPKEEGE